MIPIVATIAIALSVGVGAERRWGEGAQRLAQLTLRAMLFTLAPFVIFFNIARLNFSRDIGLGIGIAYVALVLAGGIAYLLARRLLALDRPAIGALICATIQGNTGYLGLPLCAVLFGSNRLPEAVAYDSLVQAPTLLVGAFAVGAVFGSRVGDRPGQRLVAFVARNPPLLAVAAGLIAPAQLAPDVLVHASRVVVIALLPLGFFAVGVILEAEAEAGALTLPAGLRRPLATALGLRLVLAPALLLALAAPLVNLPGPYLLLAAMPCGINGLVVAHAYGLDLRLAASAIAWSTAVVIVVGLITVAVV